MNFPAPDTGLALFPRPDHAAATFPGPDIGAVAFPPAPIPQRDAAVVMDGLASAVWVIVPHRTAVVAMDGVAGAEVSGVTAVEAVVVMDGVADAYRNVDAPVVMDAVASAAVSPVAIMNAAVAMDAQPGIVGEVTAIVTADVVAVMDARASVAIEGYITAPVVMAGAATAAVAPEVAITAPVVMDGVASATSVVSYFTPMGAYMPAEYSGWNNFTWNSVWTLTALPGYPDTILSNPGNANAAITHPGGPATINARVQYTYTSGSTQQVRILRNGTVLVTGPDSTTTAATATWTGTLNAGDKITWEFFGDNRAVSDRKITQGQTATYLTINPA